MKKVEQSSQTINDKQRKLMHKVFDVVIDQNNKGNSSFLWFSGHVCSLNVEILKGSWKSGKKGKNLYEESFYVTDKFSSDEPIKRVHDELSNLETQTKPTKKTTI
jgi:hypothetical protein